MPVTWGTSFKESTTDVTSVGLYSLISHRCHVAWRAIVEVLLCVIFVMGPFVQDQTCIRRLALGTCADHANGLISCTCIRLKVADIGIWDVVPDVSVLQGL